MITRFDDFKLLQLSLENVGPFREGVERCRFMGTAKFDEKGVPAEEAPADLYMLLAVNGLGKTTVLRSVYALMKLTGGEGESRHHFPWFGADSRAQLDFRVTLTIDNITRTTLVSIWYGSREPLVEWSDREIDEWAAASEWAKVGYLASGDRSNVSPESNGIGKELTATIRSNIGRYPTKLYGLSSDLPSVLFFPANRSMQRPVGERVASCPEGWGYQPAQLFESDGPTWGSSIDSTFVWLEWLGDGRLSELLDYVNKGLFEERGKVIRSPRRDTFSTMVATRDGEHSLDQLSDGERALLQLYVRTLCHMTENTVILIDEIESHLHTTWMHRFFGAMKALVRDVPSLSVVFTTHNRELLKTFDHRRREDGVIKGGYLKEEGIG